MILCPPCQEITNSNRISLTSRADHIRVPIPLLQTWARERITLRLSNLICPFLTTDTFPLNSLVSFWNTILVPLWMRTSSWKNTIFSVTPGGHLQGSRRVPVAHLTFGVATQTSLWLDFQSQLRHLCCLVLQTHHRPAVFHQVDADDAQERSETQLRAQQQQQQQPETLWKNSGEEGRKRAARATHDDAGVVPGDGHVVGAGGGDQTYGQDHQGQSQQGDGDPQGRSPAPQVLN